MFDFSHEIWSWFLAALKVDRAILSYLVSYYYTARSDDIKVLKSGWNFVKTKTTTPGNNIYTLLITFIAFTSFISSKFQTLFLPYKLSYYAWATCGSTKHKQLRMCVHFLIYQSNSVVKIFVVKIWGINIIGPSPMWGYKTKISGNTLS